MRYIILDIETEPQANLVDTHTIKPDARLKDEEKIKLDIEEKKAGLRKTLSLDHDYNHIRCIGVKYEDDSESVFFDLLSFSIWANKNINPNTDVLVGYNLKSFDIPTIIKQGIKQGLELPYKYLMDCTKKYNTPNCIDLQNSLSFDQKWKSLEELLQIYLGRSKTPIDFATCTEKELYDHCEEDIRNTYDLFKLFKPIL